MNRTPRYATHSSCERTNSEQNVRSQFLSSDSYRLADLGQYVCFDRLHGADIGPDRPRPSGLADRRANGRLGDVRIERQFACEDRMRCSPNDQNQKRSADWSFHIGLLDEGSWEKRPLLLPSTDRLQKSFEQTANVAVARLTVKYCGPDDRKCRKLTNSDALPIRDGAACHPIWLFLFPDPLERRAIFLHVHKLTCTRVTLRLDEDRTFNRTHSHQ